MTSPATPTPAQSATQVARRFLEYGQTRYPWIAPAERHPDSIQASAPGFDLGLERRVAPQPECEKQQMAAEQTGVE